MDGFTVNVEGKKLPLVTVFERSNNKFDFRIITEETILDLSEVEAKRLYRQLHIAFRPTKRPPDSLKAAAHPAPRRVRKSKVIRPAKSG